MWRFALAVAAALAGSSLLATHFFNSNNTDPDQKRSHLYDQSLSSPDDVKKNKKRRERKWGTVKVRKIRVSKFGPGKCAPCSSSNAWKKYQAVVWLRNMDQEPWKIISKKPSKKEFCLAPCNGLEKVNPGAVHKGVENPISHVKSTEDIISHPIDPFAGSTDLLDIQEKQIEELKSCLSETRNEVEQVRSGWIEEHSRLEHHIKGLEVASSSYYKILEENRMLYNLVQDLKGTIRVYCRVKPFLSGQSNDQSTVDYIGENGDIMIVNPLKKCKEARKVFTFDKVFGTSVTQQQIDETRSLIRDRCLKS